MTVAQHFGRLGVGELVKDHYSTFYTVDANGRAQRSKDDIVVFIVVPVLVGAVPALFRFRMESVGEALGGLAILTGLLFGLLVHVFGVGIKIAEDPTYTATSRIATLARELMNNVAYACALGVALTALLGVVAAVGVGAGGVNPVVTMCIVIFSTHLAMTLLMILKRVRKMYQVIGT